MAGQAAQQFRVGDHLVVLLAAVAGFDACCAVNSLPHLLGAGAVPPPPVALEVKLLAIKALETGIVPPIANVKEVDPDLGQPPTTEGAGDVAFPRAVVPQPGL